MKQAILRIFILSLLGISCQKDNLPSTVTDVKFMSLTAGSTWNYELTDNTISTTIPYTVTSTSRDSTVNGKAYHVFTNSSGSGNEYYNITGNDYYSFIKLPVALGASSVENLYLKDNAPVGTSWSQSYPVTISGTTLNAKLTNTITEKGIAKIVKGITYNNVIHVTTTVAVTYLGFPLPASAITTDVQTFYAGKSGMIQSISIINLNYAGVINNTSQQMNLVSSNIK